jgi:hypothetical protein
MGDARLPGLGSGPWRDARDAGVRQHARHAGLWCRPARPWRGQTGCRVGWLRRWVGRPGVRGRPRERVGGADRGRHVAAHAPRLLRGQRRRGRADTRAVRLLRRAHSRLRRGSIWDRAAAVLDDRAARVKAGSATTTRSAATSTTHGRCGALLTVYCDALFTVYCGALEKGGVRTAAFLSGGFVPAGAPRTAVPLSSAALSPP